MIPKIIHYCWFGGKPLPDLAKKYIETWKKHCPDYQICEWNENNFDIRLCKYVSEAYDSKKWAFVADFVRFFVLHEIGGIYLDTDVEILKNFDDLLDANAFFGFGSENLSLPVFGCVKNSKCIEDILEDYYARNFILADGSFDLTTIERTAQKILINSYGLAINGKYQILRDNIKIYPKEYFYSTDWQTGITKLNPKLYVIHHAEGSWLTDNQKLYLSRVKKYTKVFGKHIGLLLGYCSYVRITEGFLAIPKHFFKYILKKGKRKK